MQYCDIMNVKIKLIFFVIGCIALTSCNDKEKRIAHIKELTVSVDSIFEAVPVLGQAEHNKVNELTSAYEEYAEKYNSDSTAAYFLFESARLKTRIPDYEGAIATFRKMAEKYPNNILAPKALFAVGGIYDVTLNDVEKARAAYIELQEKYPEEAKALKVDITLLLLGKTDAELMEQFRIIQKDSLDVDTLEL